jgi:hypothetical protein
MLALVALIQVSVATPPALDAARLALHRGDTATAVATLVARVQADSVYGSEDVAALLLLRWIGRSPAFGDAWSAWKASVPTDDEPKGSSHWDSRFARQTLLLLRALDEGSDDRSIQEGKYHTVSPEKAKTLARTDQAVLGPDDVLRGPAWETRMRSYASQAGADDSLLIAALRWVAVEGWLGNLHRFTYDVPTIDPPLGCQQGCLLLRRPAPDLPLLERFRDAGPAAAGLDNLWVFRNRAPTIGRIPMLDSLWVALDDLRPSPWPYDEFAGRLRVTVCALLRLGAESDECVPLTTDLDSVVTAELRAVWYAVEGHDRLAEQTMETAPQRFAKLDRAVDMLFADSATTYTTRYDNRGVTYRAPQRVSVSAGAPPPGFWRASWPMYLEPYNERLVVHRARLLLADMARRFAVGATAPNLFDAWGRPETLVRLGIPLALARPPGRSRKQFALVTYVAPSTHETIVRPKEGMEGVSLDFALAARSGVNPTSVSGFVAEDYDSFRAMDHQVVQYARDGRPRVEVYTRWEPPANCANPAPVLGFFLLDARLQQISKAIEPNPTKPPRLKRFSLELAPGSYVYSLEMLDRSCREAERARYVLTVPPGEDRRVSDLMLVDQSTFGDERAVSRIADRLPVTVRPSLVLSAGDVARFYWELYGLPADAMQSGRVQIRFEVVNVRNQRVPVQDIGRLAQQARKRAGALDLKYDLAVPAGDGPLGFGLAVGIPEGTQGVHVARVRVTDTKTKQAVTAERAFFVRE